ncbi:MAG: VIT1/CCC1 transporter family protein, partial [Promethearchaeota archaeon]
MDNKDDKPNLLQGTFAKWKKYAKISNLGIIMRRYFVMNAFDGLLTALSLIFTNYLFYCNGENVTKGSIIIQGISITLAIGISGIMGAYLAESAERRKTTLEQKRIMMLPTDNDGDDDPLSDDTVVNLREEDYYPNITLKEEITVINGEIIEHEEVDPIQLVSHSWNESKNNNLEIKDKTLAEKSKSFATIVLSLTDGLSPALGSIIGLIPFFFLELSMFTFIFSFVLEIIVLYGLGAYLAKISEEKAIIFGIQMILAGI